MPRRDVVVERGAAGEPFRINVQTAPWYEFTLLPGVGEARARTIVETRERHGGFTSVDDLAGVPGMPRDWLDRVRVHLRCGG